MQRFRLESGGHIDRNKSMEFYFDRKLLTGYSGDTLASALLANGISIVARSIKYHRPRGILSAGLEEPNALVTCADLSGELIPNLKATEVWLRDNLHAYSQNNWPTLKCDIGSLLQAFRRFLPPGFYYKTFMWPPEAWHRIYERVLRRLAGHGTITLTPDTRLYDKRYTQCETLIIGAGASGIAEALAASRRNESVLLIDQDSIIGGSSLWDLPANKSQQRQLFRKNICQLKNDSRIRCMTNMLVFGQYDHGLVLAVKQDPSTTHSIYWRIRFKNIIFATGFIEQPMIFPDNDRPGIMLASAVRKYIYRFSVKPGRKAFVAILDKQDQARTVDALTHAGIEIVGRLDEGDVIFRTSGRGKVTKVYVKDSRGSRKVFHCDLLCMSAGYTLNHSLSAQLNVKQTQDLCCRKNQTLTEGRWSFVDFQNDVLWKDLEVATHEGFSYVEHLKRYTTVGMGTDQGKVSWPGTTAVLEKLNQIEPGDLPKTTVRPPYSPINFGVLAGIDRGVRMTPVRRSPFHEALKANGSVFQASGDWSYSNYFPISDESQDDAVLREVHAVRTAVGCVDMSTLGKVDVKGSDAMAFLSRLYCNDVENIEIGRIRYALMLREDGFVFDDGTISRLGKSHYLVTTTTANSEAVWRWMNRLLQLEWSTLDVQLTWVTDNYASLAIAGPNARSLLARLAPGFDCDKDNFPFASVRQGRLSQKIACRVFSLSYSGEQSFEINVPARDAPWLYKKVIDQGVDHGLTPYGLEALDVLRIEKGHLSVGAEIDGRTTPHDLGLGRMVSKRKCFIGQDLLQRPALLAADRLQLVGLVPVHKVQKIPAGAQLIEQRWVAGKEMESIGRMTAIAYSPTLGVTVALALLKGGHNRIGDSVWAVSPIKNVCLEVSVTTSCFYDPAGHRLRQ